MSYTFENKHTTLFANAELNVELECRASSTFENKHTTLYANAELNVELECRASSTFENKHTTLYVNAELNVELECRASSTFKNKHTTLYANAELNVELECRASSTFGNLNSKERQICVEIDHSIFFRASVIIYDDMGYFDMIQRVEKRFGYQDLPDTATIAFNNARQDVEEDIDDWADRIMTLTTNAFRDLP
ncbi:hypothetical protein DPMN_091155 [Dreissena polymorpha]|uniref:Uncharacterized protein n=1 Tax=Dreissena polymorpha TaxID=45954 RepID=A0A9D4R0G4_DREPO|nr:hypothetical protein DPMN_091155 [Dreissena polymorpha]